MTKAELVEEIYQPPTRAREGTRGRRTDPPLRRIDLHGSRTLAHVTPEDLAARARRRPSWRS